MKKPNKLDPKARAISMGSSQPISISLRGLIKLLQLCLDVPYVRTGVCIATGHPCAATSSSFLLVLTSSFLKFPKNLIRFSSMVFSEGAKRLCVKGFLIRGIYGCNHQYSTMASRRAFYSHLIGNPQNSATSTGSNLQCRLGIYLRRFSDATSGSDQMNLIKQLRERTSSPIKDVKAALVETNWDIEAAHRELRKKGKVLASKKSARTATEGLLALAQNEDKVAVIELNCETDFVARNEIFQHLALSLAKQALLIQNTSQHGSGAFLVQTESFDDLIVNLEHPKISGETTVQNAITEVAAMMGENVKLRRGFLMSAPRQGIISTYHHSCPRPGLGRIAAILTLEVDDSIKQSDALRRVGSEVAMHVVAAKPLFLTKDLVSSDAIASELEILKSQAESSGKSQMAIDKMVEGRLRKYFEDVVLMEQKFILNDTVNIKAVLSDLSKEMGSAVKIGSFMRIEVGEGMERLEASDASEPAAQAA